MTIFRETDKYTCTEFIDEDGDEYEKETFLYRSTSKIIKRRLEIMGFSLTKIKKGYEERSQAFDDSDFEYLGLDVCLPFEKLLENLKYHFEEPIKHPDDNVFFDNQEFIENAAYYFLDFRELIYCLVSVIDESTVIEYDLSEMGINPQDKFCTQEIGSLNDDFHINERVLIITEGKTDIEFLSSGLKILFPEYYGYYSFLDFDLGNIGGSVSSIEKIVQGFLGSGVRNRIIVLFDNDIAGKHGIANLSKSRIPENIKILQYPDIEIAEYYPTIGPGGIQHLNVNGLAGGIELYLGRNILTQLSGELEPVQWLGYDEKFKKYQGSLLNKKTIQDKFRLLILDSDKITKESNPELVKIFELIFTAFI